MENRPSQNKKDLLIGGDYEVIGLYQQLITMDISSIAIGNWWGKIQVFNRKTLSHEKVSVLIWNNLVRYFERIEEKKYNNIYILIVGYFPWNNLEACRMVKWPLD